MKTTNTKEQIIYLRYFIFIVLVLMCACTEKTSKKTSEKIQDSILINSDMIKDNITFDTINDCDIFSKILLPKSHTIIHGINKNIPKNIREKPNTRKNKNLSLKTPEEIKNIFGEPIKICIKVYQKTDTIKDMNLRKLLSNISNPILMEADYGEYNGSWYKIYFLRENGKFKSLYGKHISVSSGDNIRITKYVLIDQEDIPQE